MAAAGRAWQAVWKRPCGLLLRRRASVRASSGRLQRWRLPPPRRNRLRLGPRGCGRGSGTCPAPPAARVPEVGADQRLCRNGTAPPAPARRGRGGTVFWAASGASRTGSRVIVAGPLTRRVSVIPGTKKINPTCGLVRMLAKESTGCCRAGRESPACAHRARPRKPGHRLGARIDGAVRPRARQHEERRERDEAQRIAVEVIEHLLAGQGRTGPKPARRAASSRMTESSRLSWVMGERSSRQGVHSPTRRSSHSPFGPACVGRRLDKRDELRFRTVTVRCSTRPPCFS